MGKKNKKIGKHLDPINAVIRRQKRVCTFLETLLRSCLGLPYKTDIKCAVPISFEQAVAEIIRIHYPPVVTEDDNVSEVSPNTPSQGGFDLAEEDCLSPPTSDIELDNARDQANQIPQVKSLDLKI